MKKSFTVAVFSLILFGFSNQYYANKGPQRNASITETYWRLTELMGLKIVFPDQDQKEIHFMLKKETERIVGNSGCNTFTGMYELNKPNKISFSRMISTKMACLDMKNEKQFLQVLGQTDSYYIKGDTLQLLKAKMAPLAKFVAIHDEE